MMRGKTLEDFVVESNRIEGIVGCSDAELEATAKFVALRRVDIPDLESFVSVCAPGHVLRRQVGLNVRVGNYIAPPGGPEIEELLSGLLYEVNDMTAKDAWEVHIKYETIHPFSDGNGHSGRVLWLWMMGGNAPIGFLHRFYYQTLQHQHERG